MNRKLDYAKYQLDTLIALLSYDSKEMIRLNEIRALCSIECVIETMDELKKFIKDLNYEKS